MLLKKFFCCVLFLSISLLQLCPVAASSITIRNNGYQGLVIAINPSISYDPNLISKIKQVWTDTSQLLFQITNQRIYIGSIKILVPKTWNQVSYQRAINESYDSADVIIADPNPLYRNQPYVVQYGGCGVSGSYIHLTPEFFLKSSVEKDFGSRHKAIIHEWTHYRWGVFDEYPSTGSPSFYFNENGGIEGTKCPSALRGVRRYIDPETGAQRECQQNSQTRLPEKGCIFVPYETQPNGLNVSMMSFQFLSQVNDFCTSDRSNLINRHNMEAPTEQNRLCNLRSVWDVIMSSPDFANGLSPRAGRTVDTRPSFEVLQPESYRRYVLVLDTSGSMAGGRLEQMRQVVSLFISRFVPNDDEVALVEFSSAGVELSRLRKISGTSVRSLLLNEIPAVAQGSTCIGCGIQEALKILERDSGSASGANIIVFTDGEENTAPMVADVRNSVLSKKAIIHAIFFVTQANAPLQNLAIDSGGDWFQLGLGFNSTAINDVFGSLAASNEGDTFNEAFRVYSTSVLVSRFAAGSGEVQLDGSLGESTTFIFAWSSDRIEVILESPSGCLYSTQTMPGLCPNHVIPVVDGRFKTVTLTLPGVTQTGRWRYSVSSTGLSSQLVTVTVTSKAANRSVAPIVVRSGIDKPKAGVGEAVVVFAQVSQNFVPVLGATVYATIESSRSKQRIQLFDNGSGPDVRRNDGIYSRYFTGFDSRGRYSIQISVTKEEPEDQVLDLQNINPSSRANINFAVAKPNDITTFRVYYYRWLKCKATVLDKLRDHTDHVLVQQIYKHDTNLLFKLNNLTTGTVEINPTAKEYMSNVQKSANTGNFSRVVIAPGFEYTGTPDSLLVDHFPPNQITDLVASLIEDNSTETSKIKLIFTAPGSDYDTGRASFYVIRYTVDNLTSLIQDFNSSSMIDSMNITSGNLSEPQEAESRETFILDPPLPEKTDRIVLGFSIQAFDEAGNASPPSNIAPITFLMELPTVEPENLGGEEADNLGGGEADNLGGEEANNLGGGAAAPEFALKSVFLQVFFVVLAIFM